MATNVQDLLTEMLRDQDTRGPNPGLLAREILGALAARDLVVTEGAYLRELQGQLAAVRSPAITVADAWMDPGPVPAYHRKWQERLRTEWPTLARAVEQTVAGVRALQETSA
jgi:hypothetical protein